MNGTKLSRIISYGHPGGGAPINGERRRKRDFRRWLRKKEIRDLREVIYDGIDAASEGCD